MARNVYTGVKNLAWRNLPSGYTQVEYIQSNGTQYIDAGFKPNNNTRVVMDFQFASAPTSNHAVIFGARDATNVNSFCVFYIKDGYFRSDYGTTNTNQWAINSTTRYTIDKNKETTSLNNTTQSYSATTFRCNYNLYLFALNTGGSLGFLSVGLRVYSCQIYDNGTLARDYVPCVNSDGIAGLYDVANGVFYGNKGTGSFTAGETLGSEFAARKIRKVYIGDRDGVAREVIKAYFGDKNRLAQKWFSSRTTWAKYNCDRTFGPWVRDDNYSYEETANLYAYRDTFGYNCDFSEENGFSLYDEVDMSFYSDATAEDVANRVNGAYYVEKYNTSQLAGFVTGVEDLDHISDNYYVCAWFEIKYFARATREDIYSKGSTSYGKIVVSEGELPESGTLIKGSVAEGYCVLRIGSDYYYYEIA